MYKMRPSSVKKRKIADHAAVPYTNPLVGKAVADRTFHDLGGKNVRVKKAKSWFKTRY